jgi:hypothetical protein
MAALNGEPQTQTDRANELNNVARQDLRLSVSIALVSALSAHPLFLNQVTSGLVEALRIVRRRYSFSRLFRIDF